MLRGDANVEAVDLGIRSCWYSEYFVTNSYLTDHSDMDFQPIRCVRYLTWTNQRHWQYFQPSQNRSLERASQTWKWVWGGWEARRLNMIPAMDLCGWGGHIFHVSRMQALGNSCAESWRSGKHITVQHTAVGWAGLVRKPLCGTIARQLIDW